MDTDKTPDVAEMTRFLAIEAMGWEYGEERLDYKPPMKAHWKKDGIFQAHAGWSPDTVPADRDMLVEEMRKKGFLVDVLTRLNGERQALVYMDEKEGDVFSDVANTPGRVVVRAAAKALLATMKEQHHDT